MRRGSAHKNNPQKAYRPSRLIVGATILCSLLLGFSIGMRTPQEAPGVARAAAQANVQVFTALL